MQKKKESLNKNINLILFQDVYGILQLSANATLTKAPKLLILVQWVHSILRKVDISKIKFNGRP